MSGPTVSLVSASNIRLQSNHPRPIEAQPMPGPRIILLRHLEQSFSLPVSDMTYMAL